VESGEKDDGRRDPECKLGSAYPNLSVHFSSLDTLVKYGFSFNIIAVYRSARIWRNSGLMACAKAQATKPEFLPKCSPYFTTLTPKSLYL
jgi:hypothetical protein